MKKISSILLCAALFFGLTACGNSTQSRTEYVFSGTSKQDSEPISSVEESTRSTAETASSDIAEPPEIPDSETAEKTLVVYFTWSSNTEGMAKTIAELTGGDIFEIVPAVNQVETHVFQQQKTAHEYMKKYGVQHEGWASFAEGKKDFFANPLLNEIGSKYGKTAVQTALRFLIQSGVVVIPKSTRKERMIENFSVFDFALTDEDMAAIQALDENQSLFLHYDPSVVEWLTKLH